MQSLLKIKSVLGATHFVEQWKDKNGANHFTRVKPIGEFNRALASSRYGFKTIAVFKILPKPGVMINQHHTNTLNQP